MLIATALVVERGEALRALAAVGDPALAGPCSVVTQDVRIGEAIEATLYYPDAGCEMAGGPPYPSLVLAHGFSMFGLSDGRRENANHGRQLASWGYVVAVPKLPDDFAQRLATLQKVVDHLEEQTGAASGPLAGIVDAQRIGLVGHSLGGATVLALAAKDARVDAVVALDPVYHGGMPGNMSEVWDPRPDAPCIAAPVGVLAAPPSGCNAEADHARLYPLIGGRPKASFRIEGASHCAFSDPGNAFCNLVCPGLNDALRKALVKRYMTAWLNVYLAGMSAYDTFLYGAPAEEDIRQGLIVRQVEMDATNRRGFVPLVSR